MRMLTVAAAQMGPIQKADSREAVIARMIALLDEAKERGADPRRVSRACPHHLLSALVS